MSGVGHRVNGSDLDKIKVVDISSSASWGGSVLGGSISDRSSGDIRQDGYDGDPDDDVHFGGPVDPFRDRETLVGKVLYFVVRFLRRLDTESVTTFQTMYYVVFAVVSLLMVAMPDMRAYYVSESLGRYYYDMWLIAALVCPLMTLIGRRLTTLSSRIRPGGSNPALGAAWLQLAGDTGVWGTVLVYVTSMLATDWWTRELYPAGFLLMGVLGGGMFTLRSTRRIAQIERRNRVESWKT